LIFYKIYLSFYFNGYGALHSVQRLIIDAFYAFNIEHCWLLTLLMMN